MYTTVFRVNEIWQSHGKTKRKIKYITVVFYFFTFPEKKHLKDSFQSFYSISNQILKEQVVITSDEQ